jgi:hypothetical protein
VKIELTEAEADRSLHPNHTELWVRVLSDDPLNPDDWRDQIKGDLPTWASEKYQTIPCAYHCDLWDDDDPEHEQFGFEQWWILPSRGATA